jgi:hypothetical protein
MGGEYERARGLCNLASTIWEGQIDGFLRMEGGFEIIMCNFEKHLFRTHVIAIKAHNEYMDSRGFFEGWPYMKAITKRYDGIAGDRVRLDYNSMVSVFSYVNIDDLFDNDVQSDCAMPRLQNVKAADLQKVKNDITKSVLLRWDREHTTENTLQRTGRLLQTWLSHVIVNHYTTCTPTNECVRTQT